MLKFGEMKYCVEPVIASLQTKLFYWTETYKMEKSLAALLFLLRLRPRCFGTSSHLVTQICKGSPNSSQIVLMRIVCDLSSEGANHLNEKQAANDEGVKSRESPVIQQNSYHWPCHHNKQHTSIFHTITLRNAYLRIAYQ